MPGPEMVGGENATPLEEFLASIDRAALLGKWQDKDCMNIAVLRLADPAKAFYNACTELHTEDASWQDFKGAFRERFRDVHSDQYHYTLTQLLFTKLMIKQYISVDISCTKF